MEKFSKQILLDRQMAESNQDQTRVKNQLTNKNTIFFSFSFFTKTTKILGELIESKQPDQCLFFFLKNRCFDII